MLHRHAHNPIITREMFPDIPPQFVDVTSVFNPGAVSYQGKVLLMLRVQNRARETGFVVAVSEDGIHFEIECEPVTFLGIETVKEKIYHCYDARITQLDDRFYLMFAMDMESGCHLGLAETTDFKEYRFLGIVSEEDNRNGVLFPEKINGSYYRLDRPNRVQLSGGPVSGDSIFLSRSNDLLTWEPVTELFSGRHHYWDERIGAGPPPIKTKEGWLEIYHGIATHFGSINIYQAGVCLLDLDNPARVIARGKYNILEPRELYELVGQVPNVVFPSGAVVLSKDSDEYANPDDVLHVYYGAADTCVCLATATVGELIEDAF